MPDQLENLRDQRISPLEKVLDYALAIAIGVGLAWLLVRELSK